VLLQIDMDWICSMPPQHVFKLPEDGLLLGLLGVLLSTLSCWRQQRFIHLESPCLRRCSAVMRLLTPGKWCPLSVYVL
jgi:hypothetical protein